VPLTAPYDTLCGNSHRAVLRGVLAHVATLTCGVPAEGSVTGANREPDPSWLRFTCDRTVTA